MRSRKFGALARWRSRAFVERVCGGVRWTEAEPCLTDAFQPYFEPEPSFISYCMFVVYSI
jgi:hypothetical protein